MLERVASLARAACEQHGFEVIQLKLDARRHLRLWIDRPPPPPSASPAAAPAEGPPPAEPAARPLPTAKPGVNVDDCARVTRLVGEALEADGIDPGSFHIDVQSPGVDRLLVRPQDFTRFSGQEATVRLIRKRDDRANWKGVLVGFADGCVVLTVDGHEQRFPLAEVHEARLVPQLPFGPHQGSAHGQKRGASGRHPTQPHQKRGHRKRKRKRDAH